MMHMVWCNAIRNDAMYKFLVALVHLTFDSCHPLLVVEQECTNTEKDYRKDLLKEVCQQIFI
jgi:hypothetical protein